MNRIDKIILLILFHLVNPVKTTVATNGPAGTTSDSLRRRHNSQQILTKNLPDISFAVTTLEQFVRDVWQHRNILCTFRHVVRAIKISADADMIDTRNLHDVIDMIDQLRDRKRR